MNIVKCRKHKWASVNIPCPACTLAALRAENEVMEKRHEVEQAAIERLQARIAQLEAALKDARYLLENHASEKHVLERIAAVLKGDAE